MKYSIEWLQNQIEKNIPVEYHFFWGHTPKRNDVVDRSCFSQWYPSEFKVGDIVYFSAEHWMMAKKALLFNDAEIAEKILAEEKPAVAKALGREVKNFDATVWNEAAYSIVVEGNQHKFFQDKDLKQYLINTRDKIIVEASPLDPIWGIGLAHDAKQATDPFNWKGTNLLGFALMEVRDILKK
jgi:ribA/ribD-fused uncharacterized protein